MNGLLNEWLIASSIKKWKHFFNCGMKVMWLTAQSTHPTNNHSFLLQLALIKKKVNSKRLLVFSLLMKKMEQAWRTKTIEEIGEVKFMCARGPGAITHNSLSSIKRQQSTIPAHFILLHYWFALFVSERWVCGREASLPKKMKQLSRIVFTH